MESSVNVSFRIPVWLDKICACPVMWYRRRKFGYSFRKIHLSESKWTILDQKDYCRFAGLKWYLTGDKSKFYAVCNVDDGEIKTKTIRLHREIMNAPKGLLVDHKNGDGLDNRRDNLRIATKSQNVFNRRKKKNTSSRFIGVYFHKKRGLWEARIQFCGKVIWLGYFDSEIEAARDYDAAARKYHGEFAKLNFPEEIERSEVLLQDGVPEGGPKPREIPRGIQGIPGAKSLESQRDS